MNSAQNVEKNGKIVLHHTSRRVTKSESHVLVRGDDHNGAYVDIGRVQNAEWEIYIYIIYHLNHIALVIAVLESR